MPDNLTLIIRDRNNNIRINFAFAEQLKEEDMELLMKEGGFLTEVPDHIIDSFNMENREYIEDCSLAEVIRQMDKGFIQEHEVRLFVRG